MVRGLVQRVLSAEVTVEGKSVAKIGKGLCVLVGINQKDDAAGMESLANKILNIRVYKGKDGKDWTSNVVSEGLEILCVSQFTLYAILAKGKKLDFHRSMAPDLAKDYYEKFVALLQSKYKEDRVKDGKFGAHMQVSLVNDGPVTVMIDTNESSKGNDLVKEDEEEEVVASSPAAK